MGPTAHKLGGKDLPHGPLSSYVEGKVKERLRSAYEAEAKEKGVPVDEVIRRKRFPYRKGETGRGQGSCYLYYIMSDGPKKRSKLHLHIGTNMTAHFSLIVREFVLSCPES